MVDYAIAITLVLLWLLALAGLYGYHYYTLFVAEVPRVYTGSSKMKKFLEKHVSLKKKFFPSPFLTDGRLQTICAQMRRSTSEELIPYSREIFTLADGGEVALDYMMLDTSNTGNVENFPVKLGNFSRKPVLVLLIPGMNSSSQNVYIRTIVQSVIAAGASVVVLNHRGCGGIPYKSPRTHTACYIGDLEEVAPYMRSKFPEHRIIALGTSLGGVVFSKYIITHPDEAEKIFECAIVISVIWDAHRGTESLEMPFINKYVINRDLTLACKDQWREFLKAYENPPFPCDVQGSLAAKTMREFDSAVCAPEYGFPNVLKYYDHMTSVGLVHKYSIPVFALHAKDDPAQPGDAIPIKEAKQKGSKLALIVTSRGGHLGWVEGFRRKSEQYLERLVGELVTSIRLHGQTELNGV